MARLDVELVISRRCGTALASDRAGPGRMSGGCVRDKGARLSNE